METDNSDFIDSDTEAYLYSQVHHNYQPPPDCDVNNTTEERGFMTLNDFNKPDSSENFTAATAERTTVAAKNNIYSGGTRIYRTIRNDRTSFKNFTVTQLESETRRSVVNAATGIANDHRLQFSVPNPTNQSAFSMPAVKVITDEELTAERQNRRQPLAETLTSPSKRLSRKRKVIVKQRSDDSSNSCDDEIKDWPQSGNHKVVINIGSSADDDSHRAEAEQDGNDLSLWEVSEEDRLQAQHSKDKKMYIVCYNCRERGHLSKSCKKPKRLVNCFLCGQPGHKGESCSSPVCNKCLLPGHWYYQCRWSPSMAPPCPLCHTRGHLCQQCPSIWRRYHLTTTAGSVVTVSKVESRHENKTPYCYSCGHEGHYGYECTRNKRSNNIFPVNRVVSDYSDPKKILLNPANKKLWRRKLKLACLPYSQDSAEYSSMPAKKQKKMRLLPKWKKNKIKKKNKVSVQSGTGDIVRIDPIAERSFPRTKKKSKKQIIPELSAASLRNVRIKLRKINFNRKNKKAAPVS